MRTLLIAGVVSIVFCSGLASGQSLEEKFETLRKEFEDHKKETAASKSLLEKSGVTIKFSGRLFLDWGFFNLDSDQKKDTAFDGTEDGTEFRAVRIAASGKIHDDIDYKIQTDMVGQDIDFKDVWIAYRGLPKGLKLKVGHHKEPFSLEQLNSARFLNFMERSVMDALVPGRNTGFSVSGTCADEMINWAAGVFRDVSDSGSGQDNGKLSVTARVSASPVYDDDGRTVVHVGGAASFRNPNDSGKAFATEPEAHLADDFVDTGALNADEITLLGAEAAVVLGSFSAQAEYVYADVDLATGSDPSFMGYYGQVSYFLTGETKNYSRSKGTFGRVKPINNIFEGDCGCGAWELVGRVSNLDLTDSGVSGGELMNYGAGVNWYWNPNARVMCNYIVADLDGFGPADIFQMRFQIDF
ncbi:MAG: porin [Planctomycetota bacterium]